MRPSAFIHTNRRSFSFQGAVRSKTSAAGVGESVNVSSIDTVPIRATTETCVWRYQ